MPDMDKRLLQQLLATFKEEARERIAALGLGLQGLDGGGSVPAAPPVEAMFREAHSLKAAAAAVGQKEIETLCQAMESVLAVLKRGAGTWSGAVQDGLRGGVDALDDLLAAADRPRTAEEQSHVAEQVRALTQLTAGAAARAPATQIAATVSPPAAARETVPAATVPGVPASTQAETVRLSLSRLDALRLAVEELIPEKSRSGEVAAALKLMTARHAEWQRDMAQMRAALLPGRGAAAVNPAALAAFLERQETQAEALQGQLAAAAKLAQGGARGLGTKVDQLLRDVKQILTVQCGPQLQLLSRAARDIAQAQGKKLDLVVQGGELEVDRRVLDAIRDPLLHLVRNSVDHGIEVPALREVAGKPARATITVTAESRDGGTVAFTVADDGAGIDRAKLVGIARQLGLAGEGPGDAELLALIFQSGVSTSPTVTEISGRGLGLAIVRETVERLGGAVTVGSRSDPGPGQGTAFQILVPLVMPTYRGVVVREGERRFVIPTLAVAKVLTLDRAAVKTLEGREVVETAGAQVQMVPLREMLELPMAVPVAPAGRVTVIIVGKADKQVAFEVEAIEGDLEILVKPLGKSLVRVRNIQGATVLANGTIAPVLNVDDLLKSVVAWGRESRRWRMRLRRPLVRQSGRSASLWPRIPSRRGGC